VSAADARSDLDATGTAARTDGQPDRPTASPTPRSTRAVAWRAAPEPTPVYEWTALTQGTLISGPALIESSETTVALPPGSVGHVGEQGEVRFDDGV
jgi:N-methylhydantoinase A/oxoprolinase/acetone carboxylase beta subunit